MQVREGKRKVRMLTCFMRCHGSGRRRVCLVYCAITATALVLRLLNQYMLLFVSHVLSGLSTALLYSVFEAWYVAEHTSHLFPADWLSRTFAAGTFLNGLVAIVAGVVANASVDIGGFKAPYVLAIALQGVAALLMTSTWTENYGESSGMVSCETKLSSASYTFLC